MFVAATRTLAPDPAVRHRDALLDAEALAPQLAAALGTAVDACTLELAHYRVGSRLSTLYRVRAGRSVHRVSARTFASAARAEEVARRSPPAVCDRGLASVFWAYPHDRRIPALPALRDGRLVRYVPERAAVAAWDDAAGRPLGFAKAYGNRSGARAVRSQAALANALGETDPHLRVPRVLGWWPDLRLLASEALPGRALHDLPPAELEDGLHRFGVALARLHGLRLAVALPYGGRLPMRIKRIVDAVSRARPDQAYAIRDLYRALCESRPRDEGELVTLHRDATVRNALLDGRRVSLIDLDGVALGPASVDFGRLLAWLRTGVVFGRMDERRHDRLSDAFLSGYATLRPLPPIDALRWHAAAATLEGRGRKAVSWLDAAIAARLGDLLADARELLP